MSSATTADAIATVLAAAGVRYLFGLPGGGNNLDVIGACEAAGVAFVLAHTETGAAIMASAYGELTDTIGACLVTRGPGAASVVNGAAQAQQDRQPLLVLCDTVDAASSPRIAHQNLDQPGLFATVTTWSATVGPVEPELVLRDAIRVATTPLRGAVHLDVDPTYRGRDVPPPTTTTVVGEGLDEVAALVAAARRPVVLVGVGARQLGVEIDAMVRGTGVPVLMTYKAKGVVPDSGPNAAGTLTGAVADGAVLREADLILALGVDSIELIPNPWPYEAPVVALTEAPDPYRYFDPAVTVIGPLATLLPQLPALNDDWPAGFAAQRRALVEQGLLAGPAPTAGVAPWDVVRVVRSAAEPGSVATVDAGAHMLVVMPLWPTEQVGEVLISSGLATMGYAVPAAIGAALARPGRRIYCFVGDGGLAMCLGELETIARLHLPVTVVVFNDATLSLIKVKQQPAGHGGAAAVEYRPMDFAAVAGAMGLRGTSADTVEQLQAALAIDDAGPVLIDVRVHPDAYRHVIEVVRNGAAD